jgi:ABC-type transporter Mla subunit MlaD
MATAAPAKLKPLTAQQAKQLADAEEAVAAAQAVLDDKRQTLEKLRAKLRERLPHRETLTVGGVLVRYTPYSFETFSLKDYKDAGLRVTAQMRRFVSTTRREKWTVKRVGR